jgi:hypothetical protein
MSIDSLSLGLLIVLFAMLLLLWMRERQSDVARSGQRKCPNCGLITAQLNPRCLECGLASLSER